MQQDPNLIISDDRLSDHDRQSALPKPSHGGEGEVPLPKQDFHNPAHETTHGSKDEEASRFLPTSDSKTTELEDPGRASHHSNADELLRQPSSHAERINELPVQYMDEKVEGTGSIHIMEPAIAGTDHSEDPAATATDNVDAMSMNMELTPAAASLLPSSGIPRASTPMMESEPITKLDAVRDSGRAVNDLPKAITSTVANAGTLDETLSKPTQMPESDPMPRSTAAVEPKGSSAGEGASPTPVLAQEDVSDNALPASASLLESEPLTQLSLSTEADKALNFRPDSAPSDAVNQGAPIATMAQEFPSSLPEAENIAKADEKTEAATVGEPIPDGHTPFPAHESMSDHKFPTRDVDAMQIETTATAIPDSEVPAMMSTPQETVLAPSPASAPVLTTPLTSAPEHGTSHLMATAYQPIPAEVFAAAPALRRQHRPTLDESINVDPNTLLPLTGDQTDAPDNLYDNFSDTDSALGGESYQSSSTSATSSIYEAIEHRGRTYHSYKAGKYLLPNDPAEQDRLDFQHQMFLLQNDGRLFQAPLEPHRVNRVLDIATGTGIWAIDFADDFPNAEVIGSDLSPIQPRWCPPNCHFEVDDAEDDWVWSQPFSYIHGRALLTCFADPKEVIQQAFNALEPGGWLEFQDATFPFDYEDPALPPVVPHHMDQPEKHPLQRWTQIAYEGSIVRGRPWDNVRKYKGWFEEVGLEGVVEVKDKAALGVHQGLTEKEFKVATLHGANIYQGLPGMAIRVFEAMGFGMQETEEITNAAKKIFLNNTCGAHVWVYTVYGRKPL